MPDDDITDLLKTLYETNHEYHNIKERVVWLAGVIYLTFSVLLMAWYLGAEDLSLKCSEKCFIAGFLFFIFVFTVFFILRQTKEKVHSTMITEQQLETISSLGYLRRHADLYAPYKCKTNFWDFVSRGWSGLLILGVVCGFFAAQLVVLFGFPKMRLWLPIAIGLVVLLIPSPLVVSHWKKITECFRNLLKKLFDP